MKRTPNATKPDAGQVSDDRKQLEAANVALRIELVTAMVVINRAKKRAKDAEADLAEAEAERDAHAARVAELEWQLAEAETERDCPVDGTPAIWSPRSFICELPSIAIGTIRRF
jgi:chromosome segregation ATPase